MVAHKIIRSIWINNGLFTFKKGKGCSTEVLGGTVALEEIDVGVEL